MIYLKYATWNDTTKVLDWSSESSFSELSFIEIPTAKRQSGETLRGRRYSHKLNTSKVWTLIISADELADPTKYAFIISCFKADGIKYSTWSVSGERWGGSDTSIKEFTIETDKLPVEFLEGHKLLPEVKLELFQKVSD